MTWDLVREVVTSAFFLIGSGLILIAGIGMLRFPDLLSRLHAATKPQVLGIILMMNGLALTLESWTVGWKVLPVIIFQLATAPVAAHMVGRAGYRTDKVRFDLMGVDELSQDLANVGNDDDPQA